MPDGGDRGADRYEEIGDLRARIKAAESDIHDLRDDVRVLRQFRDWLLGAGALLGALFGLCADQLKRLLLGHP